jgi:glucuronoarabinoxylan endo-1,4-beta-xylanase
MVIRVDSARQTVAGFGASLAFYEGWLNAHPKRAEVYEAVFGELSLDILRVRTAYDYDPGMVDRVQEYVEASELVRGTPVPVLATSWGPPGYLKNTGDRSNGGTLRYTVDQGEVKFDYAGFAHWWKNAILEYQAHGINPTYITIQNEPGWAASWETCLLRPTEVVNSTDTLAGYNRALDAVYDTLQGMGSMPLILGPEFENIYGNTLEEYVNALDINKLDGISHHLYYGVDPANPYASPNFAKTGNIHPEIPHFQTEYSSETSDWFSLGGLIYMSFQEEEVVAYFYWDLIWGDNGGLVTLEFPWDPSRWTDPSKGYIKTKEFYAFKQFSAFIHPGWKRVALSLSGNQGAALAFLSPTGDSATCVVINRSDTDSLSVRLGLPGYRIHESAIYTTSETSDCLYQGALADSLLVMAPRSITTVAMQLTAYDPAEDSVAPTVPLNLRLDEIAPTAIAFSWDPSSDSIGVSGYRIYLDGVLYGNSSSTGTTVSGLLPETTYQLQVSAYDDAENESEPSEPLTLTTPEIPDTIPPLLEVSDTVRADGTGSIEVVSSEPGWVYLVPEGTGPLLQGIQETAFDSVEVAAGEQVMIGIEGLENGAYWIYAADTVQNLSAPGEVVIVGVGVTGKVLSAVRCYPNPFHEATTLRFSLQGEQRVQLKVFDASGTMVRTVMLGLLPAGEHRIPFRRDGLSGGIYLFRLEDGAGEGFSGHWIIRD